MPISAAAFRDFGPFANARIDCVEGLNIFIGENGTGKSHAMKAVYAVLESLRRTPDEKTKSERPSKVAVALEAKLAAVFRPDGAAISRLLRRRHGRAATGRIDVASTSGTEFTASISARGRVTATRLWSPKRAVFIPTREVLSMYPGFTSLYRDYDISFDETYYDACIALGTPGLRGVRRELADTLAKRLRTALGGRTEFTGDRFYVKFAGDRSRMEAHLVAEGLRKISTLERLVINGSLVQRGYLFWDEPEANLNPRLTAVIASVLCELAAHGVQVFITTHDYLLTKHLDLLTSRTGSPPTRFFLFKRPERPKPVEIVAADRLTDLRSNPIAEEFVRLYDLQLDADADLDG